MYPSIAGFPNPTNPTALIQDQLEVQSSTQYFRRVNQDVVFPQWTGNLHFLKTHLSVPLQLKNVCLCHTVQWKCRGQAELVGWPPLSPLSPTSANRDRFIWHLTTLMYEAYGVPPAAPPEGCGRPKTAARGEQFPGAEAQLDPRTGLYLSVTLQLGGSPLSDSSTYKKNQ